MDGEDPDPRFTLANERTYLAWNRTALALVGGGLAAAEFLRFDWDAVRLLVSLPPILMGGLLAATSSRRWEANERAMREGRPLPAGPPKLLAYGLAAMAVAVAVLVIADDVHAGHLDAADRAGLAALGAGPRRGRRAVPARRRAPRARDRGAAGGLGRRGLRDEPPPGGAAPARARAHRADRRDGGRSPADRPQDLSAHVPRGLTPLRFAR